MFKRKKNKKKNKNKKSCKNFGLSKKELSALYEQMSNEKKVLITQISKR